MNRVFWADHDGDQASASDGVSRYGVYIRSRIGELADCWNGTCGDPQTATVEFAAEAWRIATSPVMSPGYVQFHPQVLAATVERNNWDSSLTGCVTVITPWPAALARSRGWQQGSWWRDWPTRHLGDRTRFADPSEQELTTSSYLMASARLAFPLRLTGLPAAPAGPEDGVEEAARAAVRVLTGELNRIVAPVVELVGAA